MAWSVVVIARNEAARIALCIERVAREMQGRQARLTVILNGSTDGSVEILRQVVPRLEVPARALHIGFGDKSNAWNQYIFALAPEAETHLFVDGYAHVAPGAFAALALALERTPHAHAASGLPSGTPSAAQQSADMARHGGMHGSLHALRGGFVARVQREALRLPVGLYRGDGLIGSYAMHDFDALGSPWDPSRVALVPEATWAAPSFSAAEIGRHLRRRINQARGRWEVEAIKRIIYAEGFAGLPRSADDMLRAFLRDHPQERPGWRDIAGQLALRRLQASRAPAEAALVAQPLAG